MGGWADARYCKFGTQQEQRIESPYERSEKTRIALQLVLAIPRKRAARLGGGWSGCLEPDNHHHFPLTQSAARLPNQVPNPFVDCDIVPLGQIERLSDLSCALWCTFVLQLIPSPEPLAAVAGHLTRPSYFAQGANLLWCGLSETKLGVKCWYETGRSTTARSLDPEIVKRPADYLHFEMLNSDNAPRVYCGKYNTALNLEQIVVADSRLELFTEG